MRTSSFWKNVRYPNTQKFVPPIMYGKVVNVLDGDIITVASPLFNTVHPIYRFSVRLRGVESPEIRESSEYEKELAIIARNALSSKVLNKMVILENTDLEKYGRILADVFLAKNPESESELEMQKKESISISQWMLKHNYTMPYSRDSKNKMDEEKADLFKISTW
jgi:endonuclease YncB( thermonuclease family)